jgi:geranylgeranyl diphosphate synthase, type I
MSLLNYSELFRPKIEDYLHQVIDQSNPPGYKELKSMLFYHMGWEGEGSGSRAQGKRIRPIILLLCTEICGGNWEAALPIAAAVELIHNFSLIHDDIEDQSLTRHGRPTVWSRWGIAQAINTGDLMFTLAFQTAALASGSMEDKLILESEKILFHTTEKLTRGQFLDLHFEQSEQTSLDDYWLMIEGKTAALISACAELGALIAGADHQQQKYFRDFGRSLGLAFQVVDDWLGIWGNPEQTGKSNDSDLMSYKKTLPVLHSLARNGEFAKRWNKRSITSENLSELEQMLIKDGSQNFTQDNAEKLTIEAMNFLKSACPVENDACLALEELARTLTQRRR